MRDLPDEEHTRQGKPARIETARGGRPSHQRRNSAAYGADERADWRSDLEWCVDEDIERDAERAEHRADEVAAEGEDDDAEDRRVSETAKACAELIRPEGNGRARVRSISRSRSASSH